MRSSIASAVVTLSRTTHSAFLMRAPSQRGVVREIDLQARGRLADGWLGEGIELDAPLLRVARTLEKHLVRLTGVAHELDRARVLGEHLEQRQKPFHADLSSVLVVAHETIGC